MAEHDARLYQISQGLTFLWSLAMALWRCTWLRIHRNAKCYAYMSSVCTPRTAKKDCCGTECHVRRLIDNFGWWGYSVSAINRVRPELARAGNGGPGPRKRSS